MSDHSTSDLVANQSGGATINAQTVNIYGDVTGRDKIDAGGGSGGNSGAGSGGSSGNSGSNDSKPPLELSIRISAKGDDAPLFVNVSVPELGLSTDEPAEFVVPLDNKILQELRWYLELYPQWPVGPDYDRALGTEANLAKWGTRLFDAAFPNREMTRIYDEFRRASDRAHLITIDSTDPRVLQLPWELLAEEGGYLFSQRPPIGVRRRLKKVKAAKAQPFTLPVRILMVISRPAGDGIGFLDPRSSAQALLDAIEPLGERVTVEFLYPPTLKALTQRVRDPRLPPVHVVHFDGHGVYRPDTGLGYLLFENDEHEAQLVNAADLGTLLNDTGVPLMLLDACQTAQTDQANPFGSVASKLIEAGIGSVLAMNYSVLVSATRLLTAAFYGGLAQGQTIGQAVDAARFAMLMEPERTKLYRDGKEEAIQLRDWFLPALYQQSLDPAPFSPSLSPSIRPSTERTRDSETERVPTYPARGGFPDEPRYGFHGRERELLHLRRTLAERPIVIVHGYGGQGKTTLAAHAARWFTRTHLFQRAIFVSFERGGGLDYALSEMGAALLGDNFAIHQGEPVDAIAAALRNAPTFVVWDNFESILPNGDAYASDQELQKLLSAAATWFAPPLRSGGGGGGGSRLIVTTRDTNLPHAAFSPGRTAAHTELPGLGLLDALDLAAQILKDNGIARPPRQGLADLLIQLGGHPLSIQLVVPHLRTYTPDKLIAEFDALLPGFTTGAGQERNESLRVSLDFSLRRLGEDTRQLLPDLAVFQHGALEAEILIATNWKPSQWRRIRDELAQAALLTIDQGAGLTLNKTDEGPFSGYYVRFHPTLLPYLGTRLTPARRAELEACYAQAYYELAIHCFRQDSQDPLPPRAIVMRELPNFRRALDLTLAVGDTDAAADFANSIAWFLNYFGRWSERDAMMEQVRKMQDAGGKKTGGRAEYLMLSQQGERLLQQGRAAQAERVFHDLLARLGDAPSYEQAVTLARLGRCLESQGQHGKATEVYRGELATLAQLEQSQQVRRQTGVAHTDLADTLTEMGQFDAALKEYEASLIVKHDIGDDRGVAVSQGQLGKLALSQNDLNEARRRYLEALAIFRNMGESQVEAIVWHQLGMVAEEANDWSEAERCYKEALRIREQIQDLAELAKTCNQLAIVATNANRPDEAERWYKRAIEGFEAMAQTQYDATASSNLAGLYLLQGRLDEAEPLAHRAREIKETLDLSSEPWTTYGILAEIADKRGCVDEARQWRKKEQETYQAFVDRSGGQVVDPVVKQWEPVIQMIVAVCNGNTQAAQELVPFFQQMEAQDDWRNLIPILRRIMAGERGVELAEGLDRTDAAIVRRVLQLLVQPSPPTPLPTTGEGSVSPSPSQGEGRDEGESGEGESEGEGISLQDILNLVIAGARGNAQAGQQAYQITQALQQPGTPPDYRAIGKGLQNILEGLRGDDAVRGLPPEVAQIVQVVLQQLA